MKTCGTVARPVTSANANCMTSPSAAPSNSRFSGRVYLRQLPTNLMDSKKKVIAECDGREGRDARMTSSSMSWKGTFRRRNTPRTCINVAEQLELRFCQIALL